MNARSIRIALLVLAAAALLPLAACSSNVGTDESATAEGATPLEPSPAGASGAECATNEDCADGEFCGRTIGECESATGKCAARPEVCTQDYTPVCGCDGTTYGNACGAASAGQNVAHEGECAKPA